MKRPSGPSLHGRVAEKMNEQPDADQCARYLKALGEPARLKIVEFLQGAAGASRTSRRSWRSMWQMRPTICGCVQRGALEDGAGREVSSAIYLNPKFLRPAHGPSARPARFRLLPH